MVRPLDLGEEEPRFDHARRLAHLATALADEGIAAALISQPQDLYYLSGTAQPCNLLVVPGAEPVLFARRFADLARAQSAVADVRESASFADVAGELARRGLTAGRLGLELDVVPAALYRGALRAFPTFELVDCAALLLAQRAVKDPQEVALLRASASAFALVHETLVQGIAPGRTELELAADVERALRLAGHAGLVAQRRWDAALQPEGAIASGPLLATMSGGPITVSGVGLTRATPFGASHRALAPGDLLNIDLGINIAGYHADFARTYVLGEPSDEVVRLAAIVRQLEDAVIGALRPGVSAASVYRLGVALAQELGVADVFQGHSGTHGPYVGHGIGLELDEPPVLGPRDETTLAAGMVLAVEPKLISPAFGAVNLEDDVVLTAAGCELLGDVPRSVFAVDGRGSAEPLTPDAPSTTATPAEARA